MPLLLLLLSIKRLQSYNKNKVENIFKLSIFYILDLFIITQPFLYNYIIIIIYILSQLLFSYYVATLKPLPSFINIICYSSKAFFLFNNDFIANKNNINNNSINESEVDNNSINSNPSLKELINKEEVIVKQIVIRLVLLLALILQRPLIYFLIN